MAQPLFRGRIRSYNRAMASWRCPHCGSPQTETSRCWVCHRSTTSCVSCRHFRRSVAGRLGYCGLDKQRMPITGEEERACWERSSAETFDLGAAAWGGASPGASPGAGSAEIAGGSPGTASPVRRRAATSPAAGNSLWGAPIAGETEPDRPAREVGMWTESDSAKDPEADRRQHGGSIRTQPWGRVPGLRDEALWRKGVRAIERRG
jgi:hypothetical protein